MEKHFNKESYEAIQFGRWLLKTANPHYTKDNFLCWEVMRKEYDTHKLYDIFKKDPYFITK